MNKVVFFDIDGTLIDCANGHYKPSVEVEKALYNLKKNKDYVFIASGRPYAFLTKEIKALPMDGFVLANGSQVIVDGHTIYDKAFKKEQGQKLIETLEYLHLEYVAESYPYSYMKKEYEALFTFYDSIKVPMELVKREPMNLNRPIYKVEVLCKSETDFCSLKEYLDQNEYLDHFSSIDQSAIEIFAKGSTKAVGIQKILEHFHIPQSQSYAFGDGSNDIEMLSFVGTGIAMGNASSNVKKFADIVTDSVAEHGVATGILKHVI